MKKIVYYIIGGIILIILAVMMRKFSGGGAIEVATEKTEKRTIIETVSANGKVQPEVEVKMSSEVSGEIVELLVKEGQHVEKGDLLVKIDARIYQSQLEAVTASMNTSKANLANSKARLLQVQSNFTNTEASYNRNKKLFDQQAISPAEFDASKAAYEAAKADVEAAKQSVAAAEFNVQNTEAAMQESSERLGKTNIYSPVSGTISKLSVEKGERVVGTSQMAGTELLRIANLNEMEATVDVNENDIIRVHLSDTAIISVDAVSYDRKFKGIVTEIANSANTTGLSADQVTNFSVKIRVLQDSYKDMVNAAGISPFRPGMSATVDIQTKRVKDIIAVPIQAVTTRKDSAKFKHKGGDSKDNGDEEEFKVVDEKENKVKKEDEPKVEECVFLLVDGKAKLVKVKTGIQDNEYIEVTSGLKEGDEVITSPYTAVSKILRDKSRVKKVDKEDLWKDKE